jgi:microcystin-dependent protein
MAEPFLGQIELFPYTFAPYSWVACQGQLLSIQQYTALFSLLGTNFGGNGTSTFGLPNLQGCVVVSQGQLSGGSVYDIGDVGGSANIGLSTNTIPPHTHSFPATTATASTASPAGATVGVAEGPGQGGRGTKKIFLYNTAPPNMTLAAASIAPVTGGGTPHNNLQPFLVMGYYISTSGVFPTRP